MCSPNDIVAIIVDVINNLPDCPPAGGYATSTRLSKEEDKIRKEAMGKLVSGSKNVNRNVILMRVAMDGTGSIDTFHPELDSEGRVTIGSQSRQFLRLVGVEDSYDEENPSKKATLYFGSSIDMTEAVPTLGSGTISAFEQEIGVSARFDIGLYKLPAGTFVYGDLLATAGTLDSDGVEEVVLATASSSPEEIRGMAALGGGFGGGGTIPVFNWRSGFWALGRKSDIPGALGVDYFADADGAITTGGGGPRIAQKQSEDAGSVYASFTYKFES